MIFVVSCRILRNVRLMKIVGNPWHCDTEIKSLLGWLRNATTTDFYGRSYLTCASPPELQGEIVQQLNSADLPRPGAEKLKYGTDEPGLVFTIVNEGDQEIDVNVIAEKGIIYHGRPDNIRNRGDGAPRNVRVITEAGEEVDVNMLSEQRIEDVNTFDRDTQAYKIRARQEIRNNNRLQFQGSNSNYPSRAARQGLSKVTPTVLPEDLELSTEFVEETMKELDAFEESGFNSGDNHDSIQTPRRNE